MSVSVDVFDVTSITVGKSDPMWTLWAQKGRIGAVHIRITGRDSSLSLTLMDLAPHLAVALTDAIRGLPATDQKGAA